MSKLDHLNGLSLDNFTNEAAKLGFCTRVVEEDGEHFIITCDYNLNRVNVAVNDGIVTVKDIG